MRTLSSCFVNWKAAAAAAARIRAHPAARRPLGFPSIRTRLSLLPRRAHLSHPRPERAGGRRLARRKTAGSGAPWGKGLRAPPGRAGMSSVGT